MSVAEFEVVIGLALIASAAVSLLYAYTGAFILASVGIAEGLLSPEVRGVARNLHETMVPVAIIGWFPLALEARNAYKSSVSRAQAREAESLSRALQFFVGGLVTLGGLGYASSATYPVRTALGLIHLVVGLTGLFAGYAFLKRKAWSPPFLIAINIVTIVYSAFSESVAEIYALMTPGVGDALIGTIIAIIVSCAIIYLLLSRRMS